jgi:very-short-patch-repair endonuclease
MKKLLLSKELLFDLYEVQKMSVKQIAARLSCCQMSISNYLKAYDIKARPFSKEDISPWNKGKQVSDKIRSQLISQGFKKGIPSWNSGKHIKTNTGRTHFKKGVTSNHKGKTFEEMYGIDKANQLKEIGRETMVRTLKEGRIHKEDTYIERLVENILLFNNVGFVKQYPYEIGIADFFVPESNLIIECDGDYWHNLSAYIKRDMRKTEWLENNDYLVLRFKESEIRDNLREVESHILEKI